MKYPLIIRGRHIPYATEPGPLWIYTTNSPPEYQTASEGVGTVFPIFMTEDEYCACLYRVKTWKLTGSININYGSYEPGGTLYEANSSFEILFERTAFGGSQLSERNAITLSQSTQLFQSLQQVFEFQGTKTYFPTQFAEDQTPQEEQMAFYLSANLNAFELYEIEIFACGKSLTKENKLAVSLSVAFDATGDNINFATALSSSYAVQTNPSAEPAATQTMAQISVHGPFAEPGSEDLTISLFELGNENNPSGDVTFSNLGLSPHEWFTYEVNGLGPIYNAQTGEFV